VRLCHFIKEAGMAIRRAHLTIVEFCEEIGIGRSTFYDWRAKRRAPRCIKLPNGELRIRRSEYERWLEALEERAA
jgi:predicted DNA-binding transcriptional regulator AlpA